MAGYGSRVVPPDLVIGVDVGGTKMLAGVVARDGSVGRTIERPTSTEGQASLLEELDRLVEDLLAAGIAAIGVGVPMNLDRRTGIGFGAVNLPLRSLDLRHICAVSSRFRSVSRTTAMRSRSRSGGSAREGARTTSSRSRSERAWAAAW